MDFRESCLEGKAKIGMGIDKKALFYTIIPDGPTFCIDMERPYLMKLLDDRYHDMLQTWDGYEKEKELLKTWMNEKNRKTGVRNWAECIYERNNCLRNKDQPLVMSDERIASTFITNGGIAFLQGGGVIRKGTDQKQNDRQDRERG